MEYKDEEYAAFQVKLTPGILLENCIGVRVPNIRNIAKEIYKEGGYDEFLESLPHKYYDENMLHGAIISEIKDYDECIKRLESFLPFVDNWAVCDTMSPKAFKKNKDRLIEQIKQWSTSEHLYTKRFGIDMLLKHFLDDEFKPEHLEIPAAIQSEEYYMRMMIAWYFATALAKQWDATIPYIEQNRLDKWTHNKTIQKAKESYRITAEQKILLSSLRLK